MTLKFLGERDADAAERTRRAIDALPRDEIDCRAYGYLALPSRRRARLVALAIDSNGLLEAFANQVGDALAWLDAADERNFLAHLTLARSGRPLRLGRLPELDDPIPLTLRPPAVYVSELSAAGAHYRRLAPPDVAHEPR